MASIQKRQTAKGTSFNVVYYYMDENGKRKQKWESFPTHKEAAKRKAAIENQQNEGTFLPPTNQTLKEFLEDFVAVYGTKKWGVSTYGNSVSLINNYIVPILGEIKIRDITARTMDKYIQTLQRTPPVSTRTRKAKTEYVTDKTIEKIIKLLHCAFHQAVRWELIGKNPIDNTTLPKTEYTKRDIWDAETICKALDACTDMVLYIAMNLAFACSLRMGEILGLTWNNVHISDTEIAKDDAYIYIDKELIRASKQALEQIGEKDIRYTFPPIMANTTTRLILKTPKTAASVRKVWLPKTLAYILRDWKEHQDNWKNMLGEEYEDHDLVIALDNGRPCENRIIEKRFSQLKEKAGLPNVVFHSLRHSSTTYKLKLNRGDLKATQGDTGHAQASMIMQIYAHIVDEDRKGHAQKFDKAFYNKPDLRNSHPPEEKRDVDVSTLIEQLKNSPELVKALAALVAEQNSKA